MRQGVQKPWYCEVNGTTKVWFTPRSKAPPSNNSNHQTGKSWAAPELRLRLIPLGQLPPLPVQIFTKNIQNSKEKQPQQRKQNYLREATQGTVCHSQDEGGRQLIFLTQFFRFCANPRLQNDKEIQEFIDHLWQKLQGMCSYLSWKEIMEHPAQNQLVLKCSVVSEIPK